MKYFRVWMLDNSFSLVKAETEDEARKIAIEQAEDAAQERKMSASERERATTVWRVKCVDPVG